jgi:hypothetical protein
MATRHKEFASLCRKVMAMKTKANQVQLSRPVPEKSSVGTIEAAVSGDESLDDIKKAM